jgi:uncharacterized membrane protein
MIESKDWYRSKTINAGIVVVVLPILSYFGIKLSAEDTNLFIELATMVATSVGGLVAIYGRMNADTNIAGTQKEVEHYNYTAYKSSDSSNLDED